MPGYTETLGKKLIPVNSTHKIYDFTAVGFSPIQMYGAPTSVVELNTSPFAISIQDDGTIFISQPSGTESLNPSNNQTQTILTISQYRTYTIVNGVVVISNQKSGVTLRTKGSDILVDSTPPTITAITPNGISVPINSQIVVTFSESVKKGVGNILLWNETTNSQIEALNVATAPTTGAGSISYYLNQITITPTNPLPNGVVVSVRPEAGSIKDLPNNNIAAVTTGLWSFSTIPAVNPATTFTPDVVVSSVASLISTLTSWQNNPNGTVPAGKAALDDRVLGYNTSLGSMTLSNLNLPMKVYIRPVGTYGTTSINGFNEPSCSVFISGIVTVTNCSNIIFWRNDIRAASSAAIFGVMVWNNCSNSGVVKSVIRGWPHQLVQGTYGTTARGMRINSGNNLIFQENVSLFIYDTHHYFDGTINGLTYHGNMGRHSGGNCWTFDGSSFTVNDPDFRYNYMDRIYHPYKSLHGDWGQYNNAGASHRATFAYNVGYHGHWTGEYNPDTQTGLLTNAPQFLFCSQGSSTSTGPNLFEHNLISNPQQRGVDRIPGSAILTTQFNTMLDPVMPTSPISQTSPAPWPRIVSTDVSQRNYITAPASNPSYNVNQGTNGIRKAVTAPHTEILDEHMSIPTDLTDLYDIRPRVGTRTHPDYTPASDRVGCFDLWAKLYAKDPKVLLSMAGWPCATIFIEDFDPLNRFGSNYTGNYDANGDNV